jgi:hypothetical protein
MQERVAGAMTQAGIFESVTTSNAKEHWALRSEVRSFCAQTRGFVVRRVAGIVAIDFTLLRDGVVTWKGTVEHVVTDADAEYSGNVVTTVEQAMRRTMADALRWVLRDAIREIERAVATKTS